MRIFGIYIPFPRYVYLGTEPVFGRVRGFLSVVGHRPRYGWRFR